jgi:hypothetical protein
MLPVADASRKPMDTLLSILVERHPVTFPTLNVPDVALAEFCDDEGSTQQMGAESCGVNKGASALDQIGERESRDQ